MELEQLNINRVQITDDNVIEVERIVDNMFQYYPWNEEQIKSGAFVRQALEDAVLRILENVPPCPDRTVAIRKLREARMDCNSAITHKGKY